jgi:predicted Zn-dependent protease
MSERSIALGIMKLKVAGEQNDDDLKTLDDLTEAAMSKFNQVVGENLNIEVESFPFIGASLTPDENGYSALDFVQIGINEKTERKLAFVLIITDVEIAAASMSYLLALPSQLTNVAVISTRRLVDYGEDKLSQDKIRTERLTTLMLHCFGRLLNLDYAK